MTSIKKPVGVLSTKGLICVVVGIITSIFLLYLAGKVPAVMYTKAADNTWFDGDLLRASSNMTDRTDNVINHFRTRVHPLFSIMFLPVTNIIHWLTGFSLFGITSVIDPIVGGIWMAVFCLLTLKITENLLQSVLLCLLVAGSAAFMFWFSVVETYPLSSLTILIAISMALPPATSSGRGKWGLSIMAFATFVVTISDFAIGCMSLWVSLPFKKALQIAVLVVLVAAGGAVVQRVIVPSSSPFFSPHMKDEIIFLNTDLRTTPLINTAHVILSTGLIPPYSFVKGPETLPQTTVQKNLFQTRNPFGLVGAVGWVALLCCGLFGLLKYPDKRFRFFLFGALLFQLLLHTFYGEETFLYSSNTLPILLVVMSFASRCLPKPVMGVMVLVTAVCLFQANLTHFLSLTNYISQL